MKDKLIRLIVLIPVVLMGSLAQAATPDEEIADRIKKSGSVCVEGEACSEDLGAKESVAGGNGSTSAKGIEAKYNRSCSTCHATGAAGAPITGDKNSWAARMDKGIEALYQSAADGLPPAMPAKGLCFDCSAEDLKALVDYMLKDTN